MQGHKSTVGSFSDPIDLEHGSTSSNAGRDEQFCWNNQLPEYLISTNDTSIRYLNPTSQEGQNTCGWNIGDCSSSVPQNQVSQNAQKAEYRSGFAGPNLTLGERQYGLPNIPAMNNVHVNLNGSQIANRPLFLQNSVTNVISQDLNINPGFLECRNDDGLVTRCPNVYKTTGSGNIHTLASSSSSHFEVPSGSVGFLVEENDDRPSCYLEGRRVSCKRKALEGNGGQTSTSGSSSYFNPAESGTWHANPARHNTCCSSSVSTPSENHLELSPESVNPRLGLGVGGAPFETPLATNMTRNLENSQRNFRVRMNPSYQEESVSNNIFSTGNVASDVPMSHHSSRYFPFNNSLESRAAPTADNRNPQRHSGLVHGPASQRNLQLSMWSGRSSLRPGNSLGPLIPREVGAPPHEVSSSTSMPGNISEQPIFVPPTALRTPAHCPINWALTGGNLNFSRGVASTSRAGSSSGVHPPSSLNLVSPRNPARYPRRLSEYVRRSLLSSAGPSHEMTLPSVETNHGPHISSRSEMLLERQLDGPFGISYPVRTLAAASEGRSRLVSEIRNVLDLMRRGEGLRIEDVMLLDQSIFFGMTDYHDRHRDMRLDVDNMSYEELLALEDRIGYVSTGLSEETISSRLKQRKYFNVALETPQVMEPCCICQEEYNEGEDLGTLECGHFYHTECIKQWLTHKNLCPICKTKALVT